MKRPIYELPMISIHLIRMEESIATTSSTISPVGPNGDGVIEVTDWEDFNQGNHDIDL